MSIVKMSALTISGFALWLAPPFLLSRKIPLHNFTTGLALIGGFVCAFEARRCAIKLSKDEEFEAMKESAIKGDVEDELATSVYISEQERRIEAEAILNGRSEHHKEVERLERSLALDCSERIGQNVLEHDRLAERSENAEDERLERILQLKAQGYGKAKIILEIWGITKGGSSKYKAAEAEYDRLINGE
jgi:hypothetical protein